MVFALGFSLGARTTALWLLTTDHFKKQHVRGKAAWVYTGKIVGYDGTAKGAGGGVRAIKRLPLVIPIYDVALLDGTLNVYEVIDTYMRYRLQLPISTNRLLLGARSGRTGTDISTFFTNQPLGKNTFSRIVPDTCRALNIVGDGQNSKVTMHSLRASMITMLQEAGFSDSAIALRSGHRVVHSLKHYTNLRGRVGQQQFDAIFNTPDHHRPPVTDPMTGSGTTLGAHLPEEYGADSTFHGVSTLHAPNSSITINVYNAPPHK